MEKFVLSENFITKYKRKRPPFGFNGLGELVYMRTYSRIKENGKNERWWETVQSVVEGTYSMQKNWIESHQLGWNAWQAQRSAQEMYERVFQMKFLPPGRGLWAMGTSITVERGLYAALNNCAFVSTSTIKEDYSKPFCFLMDASMLGVGVGFDCKGAGEIIVKGLNHDRTEEIYMIPDTREGWVESLRLLLEAYFHGLPPIEFDYNQILLVVNHENNSLIITLMNPPNLLVYLEFEKLLNLFFYLHPLQLFHQHPSYQTQLLHLTLKHPLKNKMV